MRRGLLRDVREVFDSLDVFMVRPTAETYEAANAEAKRIASLRREVLRILRGQRALDEQRKKVK